MGFDDYNKGHMGRGGSHWGNDDWEAGNRRRQEEERVQQADRYNREMAERQRQEREATARRHQDAMRATEEQNRQQQARWREDAEQRQRSQRDQQGHGHWSAPAPSAPSFTPRAASTGAGSSVRGRGRVASFTRFLGWCFAGFVLFVVAVIALANGSDRKATRSVEVGIAENPVANDPAPSPSCSSCSGPGTRCEDSRCRLIPGQPWSARPWAVTVTAGVTEGLVICIRQAGTSEWTCSKPCGTGVSDNGITRCYLGADQPSLTITREHIEGSGIDLQVLDEGIAIAGRADAVHRNLYVGETVFRGGIRYGIGAGRVQDVVLRIE